MKIIKFRYFFSGEMTALIQIVFIKFRKIEKAKKEKNTTI